MAKHPTKKIRRARLMLPAAGASPGMVFIPENALTPRIQLYSYNATSYNVQTLKDLSNLKSLTKSKDFTYWLDIQGFNSASLFEKLEHEFKINKLVLEDITQTSQRPKIEEYDSYVFAVSRMLTAREENNEFSNDQVSFILMNNLLFTFRDTYEDCFNPVRKRLEVGKGNIRISGSSYLMYALMDMIIDTYFGLLDAWGEELDDIEDQLLARPDRSVMYSIQQLKRKLITIRRITWPERDKLNDILRSDSSLITDETKIYIRDAYDHCIQIIDVIESLKEIAANNIDMYLSVISNRMNEIMKVLTIISSIFIPLTFIAGIYGMNFSKQDPVTGQIMPQNMPELYMEHGYLYTLIIMGAIAIVQMIYFWRKGWFK